MTDAPVVREQNLVGPGVQKIVYAPIKPVVETVVRIVIAQMEPIPVKCDRDNGVRMLTSFICDSHAEITETFPVPKIAHKYIVYIYECVCV